MLQKSCQKKIELILCKRTSNADALSKAKWNYPVRISELPSFLIKEALRPEDFWITPESSIMHYFIDASYDPGVLENRKTNVFGYQFIRESDNGSILFLRLMI